MSVMRNVVVSKTKNFVALASLRLKNEATVVSHLVAGSFTQVGSLYLVDSDAHFAKFLSNLSGTDSVSPVVRQFQPLLDMGKELHFGVVGGESNLLTMRLVKASSVLSGPVGSVAFVGFVVTDNKVTDDIVTLANVSPDSTDNSIWCRVARV